MDKGSRVRYLKMTGPEYNRPALLQKPFREASLCDTLLEIRSGEAHLCLAGHPTGARDCAADFNSLVDAPVPQTYDARRRWEDRFSLCRAALGQTHTLEKRAENSCFS